MYSGPRKQNETKQKKCKYFDTSTSIKPKYTLPKLCRKVIIHFQKLLRLSQENTLGKHGASFTDPAAQVVEDYE